MFVHQDVALPHPGWLKEAQRTINRLSRFGAAGVAGGSVTGLTASVSHGNPPRDVVPDAPKIPIPVQTLDGCLMIVPKRLFSRIQFDAITCTSWYFYVANYCLDLARLGYRAYVLPHKIYHESPGPSDPKVYEKTIQAMIGKHKGHVERIYTTMGVWDT